MKHVLQVILAGIVASLPAAPAAAATVSYVLDQSSRFADGAGYLRVTVADGPDGAIDFQVEVLAPLAALAEGPPGIDAFAFNVAAGAFAGAADVTGLPHGWSAHDGGRMSGFGRFDVRLKGRRGAGVSSLAFSITGVDGDSALDYVVASTGRAVQGHAFFAAHVAGLDAGKRRTDAFFGGSTAVPLPGAAWLFGAALGSLPACTRRRARNKTAR